MVYQRVSHDDGHENVCPRIVHEPGQSVGWMPREVGKRNKDIADRFLTRYYREMRRTMLRYAIEKHPEDQRQAYLKGLV